MEPHCSIKDIDKVVNFGARANAKLNDWGRKRFDYWSRLYFGDTVPHLSKFMLIAEHEELSRQIFQKQPLLSVNGLHKAIQNEI